MKEASHKHWIDPDLETRIVALVLGEASDLERDQLMRLIEERPELATLKEQFDAVHQLLRDVGAGELPAADDDWQLSAERRNALLALICGDAKERPVQKVFSRAVMERRPAKESFRGKFAKIAAVFCVAGFFGLMAIASFGVRAARKTAYLADAAANAAPEFLEQASPSSRILRMDRAETTADSETESPTTNWAAVAERDYENDSKSALSDIRDRLGADVALPSPYYLQDEVQYFPATSEHSLPSDVAAMAEAGGGDERTYDGYAVMIPGAPTSRAETSTEALDLGRPAVQRESKSSPDIAALAIRSQESGQGQRASEGLLQPRGGVTLRYSIDPSDSQAAGKRIDVDDNGDGVADGGVWYDANGAVMSGEVKDDFSAEQEPEVITGRDLGVWLETDEQREAAPSKPMVADMEGRAALKQAEDSTDHLYFDSHIPSSLPSPPKEPMASREDFKKLGVLADTASDKEEGVNESVMPSDDDLAILNSRIAGGQSYRELQAGRAEQGARRQIEMQAKNPQQQSISGPWATKINREWLEKLPSPRLEFESMNTAATKKYAALAGLAEKNAGDEAFSTFSLHVSDVSFKLSQAALARGEWPAAAKVRIEEFVNAFDFGDPMPNQSEKVACCVEQCIHPFLQQRNLLRVSMRTAAAGRASNTPLRLTFLLDNSGSMERIDRQQTVRRAFALLAQQLKPIDQVTLISFARQPRLLADKVSGAESQQLVELIDDLPSEGGTNIEAALQLAFEKAQEQQADGAQNRIVLLTDGAVNLGDANPDSLSRMITTMRDAGIAFDAAGISAEGLNDEILEALTRKGDGRYYLLDSLEAADEGFARQIAGALRPSAKNVKVQVEFNPKRVGRYKLLGFEKHLLKQEDFRNDKVDAAEMAAAEAGVAVYQFEAKPDGEGDVGSVSVRFRDLATGQMIENRWPIPYEADAPRCDQAAPSLRIATSAALLAAKLRGEPLGETVNLKTLSDLISGLPDRDRNAKRVQQLQLMIGQARQVSGN